MAEIALSELEKSVDFIKKIGIDVIFETGEKNEFLPGIAITEGRLFINMNTLLYPGDILHEAGHIAVVPPEERKTLNAGNISSREMRDAEEMAAIAWSYAAMIYLDLPPDFVFHENGYKGGAANIVDNFSKRRYIGVPMLQWWGMCLDKQNGKDEDGILYPHMIKWTRD